MINFEKNYDKKLVEHCTFHSEARFFDQYMDFPNRANVHLDNEPYHLLYKINTIKKN